MSKDSLIHPNFCAPAIVSGFFALAASAGVFSKNAKYQIVGMTTLTGCTYGIFNNMIACRESIEFYARPGKAYPGDKLEDRDIRSLNPNLNALVYGVLCSWHVSALAGIAIATAAQSTHPKFDFKLKITPRQLIPYYIVAPTAYLGICHLAARYTEIPKSLQNEVGSVYKLPKENTDLTRRYAICEMQNTLAYLGLFMGTTLLVCSLIKARQGTFMWRPLP